jgi:hypothetical protein
MLTTPLNRYYTLLPGGKLGLADPDSPVGDPDDCFGCPGLPRRASASATEE